ncbi:ATP-binding protein [Luteolibacter luteus]|uniref:Histidine kinase domain-containing protein n=1 Tax=Luteolibacter luteus TaxID=2728835 RepID=A0A858RMF9_9BACT|nr:ATP-binding protein [Luteolibacter luteus]QJE98177.1 hypothetical protein HHL09_21105 [Luteolibacter luteus]
MILCSFASGGSVSLQDLWKRSIEEGSSAETIQVTGKVLATDPTGGRLVIADESGPVILALQLPPEAWELVGSGKILQLDFPPGRFERRGAVIDCGGGYLIEIDGRHPPVQRRASVFLSKGKHPLRLEWFNGQAQSTLQLGCEGPGGNHPSIPETWLSHEEGPGLHYERFLVNEISSLDEIPMAGSGTNAGTVQGIDAAIAGDLANVALRFTGQIEVPEDGIYQFHLTSDDGARLKIGGLRPGWKLLDDDQKVSEASWQSIESNVTYAALEGPHLRLEVATDQKRFELLVLNPAGLDARELVGKRITASGVAHEGGICVLGSAELHFVTGGNKPAAQFTLAAQIRELRPEEAARAQPAVLQGVVTMVNYRSMVLQDESGGIFVLAEMNPPDPLPEPGEWWRVEGHTASGDFAPLIIAEKCSFLRSGALPAPSRPSWDEILSGSLDAQQVEIEAVVTAVSPDRTELLTSDGTAVVRSDEFYPLPAELRSPGAVELLGARVKLRGVFATGWNPQLGRRTPGVFSLGNASLSVEELAPKDPAEVPLVTIKDLWSFASKSTTLNRVRLRGQMMSRDTGTLLVSDGTHGLRLASTSPQGCIPGDEVEVTGFPRMGPISPLLAHPVVRVLSHEKLPEPLVRDVSTLPDLSLDSRLVRVEGRVISDTIQGGERRVEMESGMLRFAAVSVEASNIREPLLADSRVRVDGVYSVLASETPAAGPGRFEIQISSDQALQVISRPPWWSTRRLLMLVAFLFGGLALVMGWVVVLQRMVARRSSQLVAEIAKKEHAETERALEQERARVARDLHDELGAGLTEIGLLGSLMGNPAIPETAKSGYLGTLGDVSRSLVSSLDAIVWAINPEYDTVDDLAGYLWLQAQRLLNPAGIECSPMKPVEIPSRSLGSSSRHALLLAFKEVLNNVIKHSKATRVDLGIHVENENMILSIADNGSGIPADEVPLGSQGIAGMHERMRDHGGSCEILARPAGGTIVNLTLPLRSS